MAADCHVHMILDGVDWKNAIRRHEIAPDIPWIRTQLARYQAQGYTYLRDGGDRWGAGAAARAIAWEYGIEYRTPLAPLCMEGHYGGFIGLTYRNLKEYAQLVQDMIAVLPGEGTAGRETRPLRIDREGTAGRETRPLPTQECWTTSQVGNALPPAHAGSGERALEKRVTELPTQECWTTSQVGNALPPAHAGERILRFAQNDMGECNDTGDCREIATGNKVALAMTRRRADEGIGPYAVGAHCLPAHAGSGERALEKRVTELPTQECWTTSQVGNALPPAHAGERILRFAQNDMGECNDTGRVREVMTTDAVGAHCLPGHPGGADFIKIMISGLMDFNRFGALTLPSLPREHIRELIAIAHDAGMAVMAHANGPDAVIAAAEAGVDSVEHGAYLNDEALSAMAENQVVWVPTLSTVANLLGKGRFPEDQVRKILECNTENVAAFHRMGGLIAPGSDAGAWAVPHGADTEYDLLTGLGIDKESLDRGATVIQKRFRREDPI